MYGGKYSNTRVLLTAEFKPFTFSDKYLKYALNIHNPKIVLINAKKNKKQKHFHSVNNM